MKENLYKKYCTGCGLCHSVLNTRLEKNDKGFISPEQTSIEDHLQFFQSVCPAGGAYTNRIVSSEIWGPAKGAYLGWSKDPYIRNKASSGGVLTSICCELLKMSLVDGIIQVKASDCIPYGTQTVISRTEEDVKLCMGSRYAISSPLENILQIIEPNKKYAFVGKPCDVLALRSFQLQNKEMADQIKYVFSFFCAGIPSDSAQKQLLLALGTNEDRCNHLQYRGNGWPGYVTVTDVKGNYASMTYNDSWGKILGRDIPPICRFCLDGIGLTADVVCGDAWYTKIDGTPDFSERDGRNIVIARTEMGKDLIQICLQNGRLELQNYDLNSSELSGIQKYQYERKATMISMIYAMKIAGKKCPSYNDTLLKIYSKNVSKKLIVKRFLGMLRRVINGKV